MKPVETDIAPGSSLTVLRKEAKTCRACDLWKNATQTVFGEGSARATIMLVGEQPGDQEDRDGRPFVGPAGKLLDEALAEAGIRRSQVYVTNAVKHFKWAPAERGKRRIHKKPRYSEIKACRPWLDAELDAIHPQVVVCLGATASQAVFGSQFRITRDRGQVMASSIAERTIATFHPSAILRAPDSQSRQTMREDLVRDLRKAAAILRHSK